ncbi:MAG TPA: carboxymuconolactone decarboxylase family protein [Terriglobales bacterium]|nr:carboxymuconolactone decarboxylase family protein [Terriglobales bacterium]
MTKQTRPGSAPTVRPGHPTGPWEASFEKLREWDPQWAEACFQMATNAWAGNVLPRKSVELIGVALNAACTSLNPEGTRRHIRAALQTGATRDEILAVLKMASVLAIHSCSLGAPILLEEVKEAGMRVPKSQAKVATPACDRLKTIGRWNYAWDPWYDLDPLFAEQFTATNAGIYTGGVLLPKLFEFVSIALNASYTHMYAPGVRRHMKAALKLGATVEEIMEVLKLCLAQGVEACNLAVPILDEELQAASGDQHLAAVI